MTDNDDLFADDYVSARRQTYASADEILSELVEEDADKKAKRHQKHTRKEKNEKPETIASKRLKKYLEDRYGARVLRTNAGFIRDEAGNAIQLGEAGQADLHALIPLEVGGFVFGVFAAIEVKVGSNDATPLQSKYLASIEARGGLAFVARTVLDIDAAVAQHREKLVKMLRAVRMDRNP